MRRKDISTCQCPAQGPHQSAIRKKCSCDPLPTNPNTRVGIQRMQNRGWRPHGTNRQSQVACPQLRPKYLHLHSCSLRPASSLSDRVNEPACNKRGCGIAGHCRSADGVLCAESTVRVMLFLPVSWEGRVAKWLSISWDQHRHVEQRRREEEGSSGHTTVVCSHLSDPPARTSGWHFAVPRGVSRCVSRSGTSAQPRL